MSNRTDPGFALAASRTKLKPALKWAGGKYRLIDEIRQRLPGGRRLIEPFVGSGAVFLNMEFERYLINDLNKDLVLFYCTLKERRQQFVAFCRTLFSPAHNIEAAYYELRAEFNSISDCMRKAALLLYLNKHGYNGLCRYNAAGAFNVPFGRYKRPYFPEREMLAFVDEANRLCIENRDFEQVMRSARNGDVIYCDPPYVPLSRSSNFTEYSAGGFSLEDQRRLASLAKQTARRGIPVLISNHCTGFTREIYQGADISRINVWRSISCNGAKRDMAVELLALYPGKR